MYLRKIEGYVISCDTVHHLFEQIAEKYPENIAVVFRSTTVTYRELNERANRLAHHLKALGVGPDRLVGIYMERSIETIIAMISILKAGGAYVPLDLKHPIKRVNDILEESGIQVLVTKTNNLQNFSEMSVHKVAIDGTWAEHMNSEMGSTSPVSLASDANLAYVLFTSGSTGIPKGVMVEHRQIINYVKGIIEELNIEPFESYAMVQTLAVDSVNTVVFPALLSGGCLHVISEDDSLDGQYLSNYFSEHQIDWLKIAPTHLAALHRQTETNKLMPQKGLVLGGEASKSNWVQELMKIKPFSCSIYNHYGPTETTVGVLVYKVQEQFDIPVSSLIPLGKPIRNVKIHILDEDMQPVANGEVGELYIEGASVARGYLNNQELTQKNFFPSLPNRSNSDIGRMYRTGDLVRCIGEGLIEFLGRIDDQVKIRGNRVELGEVTTALSKLPMIEDAIAIGSADERGDKQLLAYVILKKTTGCTQEELVENLSEILPDYMVPSHFVFLDEFPRNLNGKIDRQALPKPALLENNFDSYKYDTAIEEIVVNIWSKVLRRNDISKDSHFLKLGGNSLAILQVLMHIRDAFPVQVSIRDLFNHPILSELAKFIENSSRKDSTIELPPLEVLNEREDIPLSLSQQRFWIIHNLEPNSTPYTMPLTARFKGELQVDLFEKALNEVINRHESLRTIFPLKDGQPIQSLLPSSAIKLEIVDVSSLPVEERESHMLDLMEKIKDTPFDLAIGPLVRLYLFRADKFDHVMFVMIHHIVSDGWSNGIFHYELSTLYNSFCSGKESPLEALSIKYSDYSVWQRKWMQGDILQEQLDYWKRKLSNAPQVLELPTDYPRPSVKTFNGATKSIMLTNDLLGKIKEIGRQEGTTLFMTLVAAFKVFLYRYTNKEDIVIGTPVANRTYPDISRLIGCFVNTIVLRSQLSDDLNFYELLKRVRNDTLEAYSNHDVPFEYVVNELQPNRDLSHTPLFQVMFVLQDAKHEWIPMQGVTRSRMEVASKTAMFDLTLSMTEMKSGLEASFEYSTDLFSEETIKRMLNHFEILLTSIVKNPSLPISKLQILPEQELNKVLYEWNDTKSEYPSEYCIHNLFEKKAAEIPDSVAIVFENQQLTYQTLNMRVNQLAHYLRKRGVGPEVMVGICAEKSFEMVIGFLAILKAGGVFVPLDPTYPKARLAYMMEDTKMEILLVQKPLLSILPKEKVKDIILLDEDKSLIEMESTDNPIQNTNLDHLAFVFYTSGSTGNPKGVLLPHRGICNLGWTVMKEYGVDYGSRVLQLSNFGFDAFLFETFVTFVNGGTLHMVDQDILSSDARFFEYLRKEKINYMQASPSLLRILPAAELKDLKVVVSTGERLTGDVVQKWSAPGRLLWNGYGPTEVTIGATNINCAFMDDLLPPIGRPWKNYQVYILDKHMQIVPIGVAGEIYIGGDGLARGYLNNQEMTDEKFVPNPFLPGTKLYKTGDMGFYLSNGVIKYIDRADRQVKIRGFRIELGEIESVINELPEVLENTVSAVEGSDGTKQLICYVVFHQDKKLSVEEFRSAASKRLPNYMLPSMIVELDVLPRTPNGKIDVSALPSPLNGRYDLQEQFVAPQTIIQKQLASLWENILKLAPNTVGIHDNFFVLGGHSLLATLLFSKIREVLQVAISLREIFESPTIYALSKVVEREIFHSIGKDKLDQILDEVSSLSDQEIDRLLSEHKE
ncbi:amino acid adenylation domain-containing protein [Brevibacillus agri]|uniref:amino acid adenylation domain-containing protein n=1 Tax=Brevibacillus agri TaxID=51101 RepID=UPI003D201457